MKRGKYSRNIIAIASLASLTCVMIPPKAKSSYVVQGETTAYSIENTVESTEPVCFISESSTYFTSIEGALAVANANAANNTAQTVVVIPNVDSSNAGTPLTWITEDCQIGVSSGADVRLVLTADTGQTAAPSYTSGSKVTSFGDSSYAHCDVSASSAFADNTTSNVNKNLKSNVGIADGVKVTIESTGQLDIGGTVGTSGQRPTGHVRGEYCQVTMADKSSIVSNGGDINLYGYIKETSSNNGSSVIMNSGTFLEPLVFYDYYGGTHSSVATGKASAFPLTTYDMPSCQVISRFYSGSTLTGVGGAYADSKYYIFTANLISNSSSLFVLDDGYLDIKYTAENTGLTLSPSTNGYKTTTLTSYSTCELGSLTISMGSVMNVKSSNYHFPIPYTFDIVIASGKLSVPNKVKFLLGSNLIINSGATVEITSEVVFYQTKAGYSHAYKAGTGGTVSAAATCINNGTLTINSGFAGIVDTTVAGATLNTGTSFVNNVTLKETTAFSGSASSYTYTTTTVEAYAGLYYGEDREVKSMQTKTANSFTSALNADSKGYWSGSTTSEYTEEKYTSEDGSGGLCILPDTPILMADDTYKRAIDVKPGDLVWAFNHETGRFEKTVVIINGHTEEPEQENDVMRITMESGRQIGIVNEHGFFCVEENKYVYITPDNYWKYIGKHFISVDPITKELIRDRVVDITLTREVTKISAPATAMHINIVSADILSLEGGVAGCFNIFEFDPDTLKYDEEKMKADIEKYGLLTVEDYNGRVPDFFFDILPFKYFAVSVGKGLVSYETIDGYIEKFGKELVEGKKNY